MQGIGLITFLSMLASSATAQAAAPNSAQMNDLSILLPLATTQKDFDAYLKAEDLGLGGAMVPKAIFTAFNIPAMTAVGPGKPELDYSTLKMVALRLDPCFAQIGPITDPSKCLPQLRVIFQSLTFSQGESTAEDSGLHAFYSLTSAQFAEALKQVIALRAANDDTTGDLGPLAVHPIVAKQGLNGPMAKGLIAIVRQYAGTQNITRMTRLYSSSDFWDFNGIDIANGVATPMIIPSLPDAGTMGEFVSPVEGDTLAGSFVPATTSSDNIGLLVNMSEAQQASKPDQQAALHALFKIENPGFHSPNTIDCASCHVAEVSRSLNAKALGLSMSDPAAFIAPASVPLADLAVSYPVTSFAQSHDFHAFSYRGQDARINQRVINETATLVDYANAHVLSRK